VCDEAALEKSQDLGTSDATGTKALVGDEFEAFVTVEATSPSIVIVFSAGGG
jgi:hypothetical protein